MSFHDFGPYFITEIRHCTFTLSDGCSMACKFYLPWKSCHLTKYNFQDPFKVDKKFVLNIDNRCASTDRQSWETFGTVLEYLPYRKDDVTAARDYRDHVYMASHGFVICRADMRGSGSSSGIYLDEYLPQEISDGIELIEALAAQPWSNANVGMYGKSWGGFNGLQVAFEMPKSLKGVISAYSTDDRFNYDIYYHSGCALANGLPLWSNEMHQRNAFPPHVDYFDTIQAWKLSWKDRLNKCHGKSWLLEKLSHQKEDPYWLHGSIKTNYANVNCPVLLIGGLLDGYTVPALRMAAKLKNPGTKAIIGPWVHDWPHVSDPGPNIHHLNVCKEWWQMHIGNRDQFTDHNALSSCTLFLRQLPVKSRAHIFDGYWLKVPDWTAAYAAYEGCDYRNPNVAYCRINRSGQIEHEDNVQGSHISSPGDWVSIKPHPLPGVAAGEWCCFHSKQTAADQKTANKFAFVMEAVLQRDVVLMGAMKCHLTLKSEDIKNDHRHVAVRLCAQKDDSSEMILLSVGFSCLSVARVLRQHAAEVTIELEMKTTGWVLKKGYKLALAVSPTYFPMVFPSVRAYEPIEVLAGITLVYQTAPIDNLLVPIPQMPLVKLHLVSNPFGEPVPTPQLDPPDAKVYPVHFNTFIDETAATENEFSYTVESKDGFDHMEYSGTRYELTQRYKYTLDAKCSKATVSCHQRGVLKMRKVEIAIESSSEIVANCEMFECTEQLTVGIDGDIFHQSDCSFTVPREC